MFARRAWKSVNVLELDASSQVPTPAAHTSRSYVRALPNPVSPAASSSTRYGSSSRCSTASAWPVSRSCSAADSSARANRTSSTLSNWWTRMSPRVSLPWAPASRRKQGVHAQ